MKKQLMGVPMFFWALAVILTMWVIDLYALARGEMWPEARDVMKDWWQIYYSKSTLQDTPTDL